MLYQSQYNLRLPLRWKKVRIYGEKNILSLYNIHNGYLHLAPYSKLTLGPNFYALLKLV